MKQQTSTCKEQTLIFTQKHHSHLQPRCSIYIYIHGSTTSKHPRTTKGGTGRIIALTVIVGWLDCVLVGSPSGHHCCVVFFILLYHAVPDCLQVFVQSKIVVVLSWSLVQGYIIVKKVVHLLLSQDEVARAFP